MKWPDDNFTDQIIGYIIISDHTHSIFESCYELTLFVSVYKAVIDKLFGFKRSNFRRTFREYRLNIMTVFSYTAALHLVDFCFVLATLPRRDDIEYSLLAGDRRRCYCIRRETSYIVTRERLFGIFFKRGALAFLRSCFVIRKRTWKKKKQGKKVKHSDGQSVIHSTRRRRRCSFHSCFTRVHWGRADNRYIMRRVCVFSFFFVCIRMCVCLLS